MPKPVKKLPAGKLSVIPPVTEQDCIDGVRRNAAKSIYSFVRAGVWLLKAAQLRALPAGDRGQGRKSSAATALDLTTVQKEAGFRAWFEEIGFSFSLRTAYSWMAAAVNAGLSANSAEKDVTKLEKAKALDGKKLADLLALPSGESDPTPKQLSTGDADLEIWKSFDAQLSQLTADESDEQKALFKLPLPSLRSLETSTRRLLDVIAIARKAAEKAGKS